MTHRDPFCLLLTFCFVLSYFGSGGGGLFGDAFGSPVKAAEAATSRGNERLHSRRKCQSAFRRALVLRLHELGKVSEAEQTRRLGLSSSPTPGVFTVSSLHSERKTTSI